MLKTPFKQLCLAMALLLVFGCKVNQKSPLATPLSTDDGIIEFTFLQINDVYEIDALEGGKIGGMARVATLYQQLKKENPNTLFVLAGDFLNPSLIGALKHKNQPIKGRQMVEVMNACGVDLVTFGNHEFDIKEDELQQRINESEFEWIGTNVLQVKKDKTIPGGQYNVPFHKEKDGQKTFIPKTYTWTIQDADGTQLDVGILGATINKNQQPFVVYEDYIKEATEAYLELIHKTNLVIGLTHLEINEDLELAAELPNVPLLMGGHEHHHMQHQVGNVVIAKADANATSAYVHRFMYNKKTETHTLNSELVQIDESIKPDAKVKVIVDKWANILIEKLQTIYEKPEEIIYETTDKLDGRDVTIRTQQTNMGAIFTAAFAAASKKKADLAIMNSGSVRLDDQIGGKIQAIDIFRAMPFGGQIWEVDITGDNLQRLLEVGLNEQIGKGGFLQTHNVKFDADKKAWLVGGKEIIPTRSYHLALNNYLYTRSRSVANILQQTPADKPSKEDNNDVRRDVRVAVIEYMKQLE